MAKQSTLHCSFCGRSRDEVKILIAGQEGHICENCVEHAREIIEQELMIRHESTPPSTSFKLNVKKPIEVKRFLDEYENVEVQQMEIKVNQRVRITNGMLMDQEGKVLDVRHKTAKVAIDSLGYILVAYIDRTKLTSAHPK